MSDELQKDLGNQLCLISEENQTYYTMAGRLLPWFQRKILEGRLQEAGWWALTRPKYGSAAAVEHVDEIERELEALTK